MLRRNKYFLKFYTSIRFDYKLKFFYFMKKEEIKIGSLEDCAKCATGILKCVELNTGNTNLDLSALSLKSYV